MQYFASKPCVEHIYAISRQHDAPISMTEFDAARADELVRMWRESFEGGVGIVDPHPIQEQHDYLMREVLPNNSVRVALAGEQLVGFVAATRESISQLYVRTSEQRRGVGAQLLAWAKAQSCGRLWLFTFARNVGARAFYEKHGFRIVARGFEPTWQLDDLKYEWSADRRHAGFVLDGALVRRMVATQFPQWADLPVRPVAPGGWDNRSFRLGEQMIVRLPSAEAYAAQVEKEHRWLPRLAPSLPLAIPTPLAIGKPASGYPWRWSIYRWIDGDVAAPERIGDLTAFATCLAQFLVALQRIEPTNGPPPGDHNFYRGGSLLTYDAETRQAIDILKDRIDAAAATQVWEAALGTTFDRSPVWIHGDVSPGNLLVREGRLSAVIDFGMLGVGDPACDLSIAWTLFDGESRQAFRAMLPLDPDTWARARAWTLWKALIVAAGLAETNAVEAATPWRIIDQVLGQ